ncbi:reticulocyte-binding protein 2 homolog a [Plakobranchus ocellatus]|uniref:Reticulocyte-binding protein 2 homolog a n=1 Tax=Plakobranchus ocellatus TaxID=259542 RepID=A0AAV3Z0P1_9GAST|nr:reticulocyte-binding protein 2 homolog a [Plakobranchus ocellatus]
MSELDLCAKYLDLGVKLGRSGEDLTTWVEDKVRQDMERSDRQIERERKREEMEMQRQREEMEMQKQREDREMQKLREEMAFRREEKERESQRQLELRRMELEAETKKLEIGSRASVDVSGPKQNYGAQRPKIPPLHDASQQRAQITKLLSACCCKGCGCDRNGFRHKFLTVKPQEAEDFGTFINRARRYFDRWVELSGVSTLEGLSYLVCSEIALQACDEDFVAYIKDRSPSDMIALKTVASAYMDARPNKSFRKKHSVSFVAKSEPYRSTVRVSEKKHDSRPHESGGRFNYSSKGHRSPSFQSNSNMVKRGASRSPSRDRSKPNVANKNVDQGQFRPSSGSVSSNVTCFQCGGKGHSAVNVRAAPGRQMLLLWCQSCLHIAVPPKWTVIL